MSMSNMRVQCSLLIEDEELYTNFIKPLKNNRELHGTIIKLLSAYYRNSQVRALVDNLDTESLEQEKNEFTNLLDSIKQTVATCAFLTDAAEDELNNGGAVIKDFVNSVAENSGGVANTDSEFGDLPPQFNLQNQKYLVQKAVTEKIKDIMPETQESQPVSKHDSDVDSRLTKIEDTLGMLVSLLQANPDKIQEVSKNTSTDAVSESSKDENNIDGFLSSLSSPEPTETTDTKQSDTDETTVDGTKYFNSIFEDNDWLN